MLVIVNMAQRKSKRIAERSVGFGKILRDDPMVEIASYGERPLSWNKDTRDRYSCTPNNVSYRMLPQPGAACPIEARIAEQRNPNHPEGESSLCCTSRQGNQSHEESLWFLRALKAIDQGAAQQWFWNTPPNLRKILNWINLPTNTSDVGAVNPQAVLIVHSNREKYLDIFKFALMSESYTPVEVHLPNSPLNQGSEASSQGPARVALTDGSSLYDDIMRTVNEITHGVTSFDLRCHDNAQQLARVEPVHTDFLYINNNTQGSRCIDVADITNHFETGNQRRWSQKLFNASAFAVVRSTTTIQAAMLDLFHTMKNIEDIRINNPVLAKFKLHTVHPLPQGYIGVTLQDGDTNIIGQAMADTEASSEAFNLGENQGVMEDFSFRYRRRTNFWIQVLLEWDQAMNTLNIEFSRD